MAVPVTLVEAQVPAVTVPPTKQPALEPLHVVNNVFYYQAVLSGAPYAVVHGPGVVPNEQG